MQFLTRLINLWGLCNAFSLETEENVVKVEVLVPNTCELDASQTSNPFKMQTSRNV